MTTQEGLPGLFSIEREVGCNVHGIITLIHPISAIIDTPQFQRLREIKQLGSANLVYPTADHSRFVHSLGVYKLAFKVSKKLLNRYPDKLDSRDVLCVSIAGLIHDLGHGPFSHTFDGPFMKENNKGGRWKHENATLDMWNYLLAMNPHVKKILDDYLDENDYTFIEELIMPPKQLVQNGEWVIRGRGIEKSFLFFIVSNPIEGFDVDKLDYFLRDAKNAKISHEFKHSVLDRIFKHMAIEKDEEYGFDRIAFDVKIIPELTAAYNARTKLYEVLYKHKTCVAIEQMVVDIMTKANPFLKFLGNDEKHYKMTEAIHNMSAYQLMTDNSVFTRIKLSIDDDLQPAKKLLNDLECRRIYRCVGEFLCSSQDSVVAKRRYINEFLKEKRDFAEDQFFIHHYEMHTGLGLEQHPLDKTVFCVLKDKDSKVVRLPVERLECSKSRGKLKILTFLRMHDYPKRYVLRSDLEAYVEEKCKAENVSPNVTGGADESPNVSMGEESPTKMVRN